MELESYYYRSDCLMSSNVGQLFHQMQQQQSIEQAYSD